MQTQNIVIFGDSYSTFEGYIPEGYCPYYTPTQPHIPDVQCVENTWWHMLAVELGANIVHNNSWSGSTVCNTAYEGVDCSQTNSFIYRLNKLDAEGFFADKDVDTVFVFGGTNDCWAQDPIGELKYSNWTREDLFCVLPGFCCFINRTREVFPSARIICLINSELKPEIANGYAEACRHYGIEYLQFEKIDKRLGHPTRQGMRDIKDAVISKFF